MTKEKTEQIIIDGVDVSECEYLENGMCNAERESDGYTGWECCDPECSNCYYKQLARKTQECEELKTENEELNDRMAEVTFRATGGRLSYSNYTLDAIEKAFNDQLEILSDQKVEEETKELEKEIEILEKEICNTRWGVNGDIQPTVFGKTLDEIHKILTEAEHYHKECEELKEKQKIIGKAIYKESIELCNENARYLKALEEIEKIAKLTKEGYMGPYYGLDEILKIISKAKEEE